MRWMIVLNGCCGAGKTTVAEALSELMQVEGVAHALFDLDAISQIHPTAPDDPFATALALRFLAAGMQGLDGRGVILSGVIETAADHAAIRGFVGTNVVIVLLTAPMGVIANRLGMRETGSALKSHIDRAEVLDAVLRSGPSPDLTIDTTSQSPETLARLIFDATR